MMNNLFSIFDPSSINGYSVMWVSLFFGLFFIINIIFLIDSRLSSVMKNLKNYLIKEIVTITKNKKTSLLFVSMFLFIVLMNCLGLIPYIFTPSSHMVITLTISLPLWVSFMILGWGFKTNHMFTHLVPLNTPGFLTIFMVLIESVSNFIRPITLSVRLMANMTAGHLMINLLSNMFYGGSISLYLVLFISQFFLILLEIAVAMIQSYVLVILSSLYSSET